MYYIIINIFGDVLYLYNIKRKREIKEILNEELKIAFYGFTGIRIFNKRVSIYDIYTESMESGKLDGAVHKLFDFEYLIRDINEKYVSIKKRNEELRKIEEYKKHLANLNSIVEYMKTLNIKVSDDIMICGISSGKLIYKNRLKELIGYKKSIEDLRQSIDEVIFVEILKALKSNVIIKSRYEEDRHNINIDKSDKILKESLKKIRTITDIKININSIVDISEEVILDKKIYNKIMKSNLRNDLKELIKEYRSLL